MWSGHGRNFSAPRGKLDTWDFRQAVGAFTTGVTVVTTCDDGASGTA